MVYGLGKQVEIKQENTKYKKIEVEMARKANKLLWY